MNYFCSNFTLFFLLVKIIEKLPSLKPANQLLLYIEDKSNPNKGIELLSFSLIQVIALCKASILGVRL